MKKLFTLLALCSVTSLLADYPYGSRSGNSQGNYSDRSGNTDYYQQQGNSPVQSRNYADNYGAGNAATQSSASDQELVKKIHSALSSGWLSKGYQNVSFDVDNGVVNLKGSVDTLESKNRIEGDMKKIDGVRQVNNQITVRKG